jgi:hypothetical protein
MSVRTTADEKHDLANEKIKQLINLTKYLESILDDMVDPDIWGGCDWTQDYVRSVRNYQLALTEIRNYSRNMMQGW